MALSKIEKISSETNAPAIAHEMESNRQYVRIPLAASAKIGEKHYRIKNISSGGLSLETQDTLFPAESYNADILFNFEKFSFNLTTKLKPVYNRKGIAGFRFVEMSARQVSLLSYIIKSYLSGLIISEGDILNVATRNEFTNLQDIKRSNDNQRRNWLFRLIPVIFLALLGAAGLFLLFGNIYENTLIIKSPMSIVEGNIYTVRAETNGAFYSLLAKNITAVRKGQSLGILKTSPLVSGALASQESTDTTIKSPCDCIVVRQEAREGEFHALGEPLMDLVPLDSRPWVIANLPASQIHRLKLQDTAYVKLVGDSSFVEGAVTGFLPPSFDKDYVQVMVKTIKPLPLESIGRQAYVEFSIY